MKRSLMHTFWGNVAILPVFIVLAYFAARQPGVRGMFLFGLAAAGIANYACNLGIIVSDDVCQREHR